MSNLHIKIAFIAICMTFLSASNAATINDKNLDENISKEAICVVASERFLLYESAIRHKKNGFDAAKERFSQQGVENDFYKQVYIARSFITKVSKDYYAQFLIQKCGEKLNEEDYDRA